MGRVSWPGLPGWRDKGLLGALTEVGGTEWGPRSSRGCGQREAGGVLGGAAKGGRTSLSGGDRERGPCVFLARRSPAFLGSLPPSGLGGAVPGHLRGHAAASGPGLWVPAVAGEARGTGVAGGCRNGRGRTLLDSASQAAIWPRSCLEAPPCSCCGDQAARASGP